MSATPAFKYRSRAPFTTLPLPGLGTLLINAHSGGSGSVKGSKGQDHFIDARYVPHRAMPAAVHQTCQRCLAMYETEATILKEGHYCGMLILKEGHYYGVLKPRFCKDLCRQVSDKDKHLLEILCQVSQIKIKG